MEHHNVLFPDVAAREEIETHLSARLRDVLAKVASGPVAPTLDLDAFRERLARTSFDEPQDLTGLLDWTVASLQAGLVQMTNPRYFGLFNPAPTFPAECADRIAAAFNPQICVWSHAPAAVEIETHVIEQIARRAGLPEGSSGHFTSGGAEANNTAVVCALTSANSRFADLGCRCLGGQPRLYASVESHLAWLKIAHQSGIGRSAVCLVTTDGRGRLDAAALREAIETDRAAGDVPVMIAATAGTTNAGMVDPLHECGDIARQYDLWYHVDAAWGGALIASEQYKFALNGIETADSITIDAHKWFATTMGAGMFVTRRPEVLRDAFHVATDYMPSNDAAVDFYVNSMQWSRRFIGLRLFLSLAAAGWSGYARHVENGIALIERLRAGLTGKGWTVANDSRMAVACVVPPARGRPVADVVADIVAANQFWVSETRFEGAPVIRVCVTNGTTSVDDIDKLIVTLERLGVS